MFWRTLSRARYLTTQHRQHGVCMLLDVPSISTWDESLSNSQQYASFLPWFWIKRVRENQPSASDGSIDDNRQARLASFHHEYLETKCQCVVMVQSQHYKAYRFPHSSISLLRSLKSVVFKSLIAVKSSIRYCTTRDLTSCCQHPTMILATSMHFIYALNETILERSVCYQSTTSNLQMRPFKYCGTGMHHDMNAGLHQRSNPEKRTEKVGKHQMT